MEVLLLPLIPYTRLSLVIHLVYSMEYRCKVIPPKDTSCIWSHMPWAIENSWQDCFSAREGGIAMTDILSGLSSAARGLAKGFIKGGMYLYGSVSDVVAEAKADLARPKGDSPAEKVVGDKDHDQNGNKRKSREHRRRSRGSKVLSN